MAITISLSTRCSLFAYGNETNDAYYADWQNALPRNVSSIRRRVWNEPEFLPISAFVAPKNLRQRTANPSWP
jgi:hypothetical protein